MAHLIQIGNSQGVRIPKPLIKQAQLEGTNLSLHIVNNGLLICPERNARSGWAELIEAALIDKDDGVESDNTDWLAMPLESDNEQEW